MIGEGFMGLAVDEANERCLGVEELPLWVLRSLAACSGNPKRLSEQVETDPRNFAEFREALESSSFFYGSPISVSRTAPGYGAGTNFIVIPVDEWGFHTMY